MCKRLIYAGVAVLSVFCFATGSGAETIYLKNGQKLEGDIVERKEDSITVKSKEGGSVPYWFDEIDRIEGSPDAPEAPAPAAVQPPLKPAVKPTGLPFTTAIITYNLHGDVVGTETLYIGEAHVAVERHLTAKKGRSVNQSELELTDGQTIYQVDRTRGSARKMENPVPDTRGIVGYLEDKDYLESKEARLDIYDVRSETFLGRPCRVYEIAKAHKSKYSHYSIYRLFFHNGILLKMESDSAIKTKELNLRMRKFKEAVDVQFDVPIPQGKFELPPGVKVQDFSGLAKELYKVIEVTQQEYLESLSRDPNYSELIEASRTSEGKIDVEKFKELLKKSGKELPRTCPLEFR